MSETYIWSPEEAMSHTSGVCAGCGGGLSPIETVDNSDRPTYWPGCLSCQRFEYGVPRHVFDIASELFDQGERPYRSLNEPPKSDAEAFAYYRSGQVKGLSSLVGNILHLAARAKP